MELLSDKEPVKRVEKLIKKFDSVFKKIIIVPIENEPASLSIKLLFQIAKKNNFNAAISNDINSALKIISSKEKKLICIFGSLYLCGSFLNKN